MTCALPNRVISNVRRAVAKAAGYLRRKQCDSGGFCFFRYRFCELPNVRETYHAVAALRQLNAEVPRADDIVHYLNGAQVDGVDGLYYYAFAIAELGCSSIIRESHLTQIRSLSLQSLICGAAVETDRWLKRTLRTLELQCHFAALPDARNTLRTIERLRHKGGYGDKPNLRETYLSLGILALLGKDLSTHQDTRNFVDNLQRSSIGFTNFEGSQYTNLEILAAGVRSCTLLNVPVRHAARVLEFLMACQSTDGSFSGVPVALPDIARTHQAPQIIGWLDPDLLSGSIMT
jgi:hypothetical protein